MKYETREEVEAIGRAGQRITIDDGVIYGRQLSSFWLALDPEDKGYTPHAMHDGYWESWITSWMSRQVMPGNRAIDVGANHGYYSFMMQQAGVQTMAVEPQSYLCELLGLSKDKNTHQKNHVEIVHAAVSNYPGEIVQMNVPDGHGMNASISKTYIPNAPYGRHMEEVATATLDSLVSSFTKIDFIKIDVEGAEQAVWEGMKGLWTRHHPTTVLEFRWDRYETPEEFARMLFADAEVTYVDIDAQEKPIDSLEHLATKQNEDWMLVLRKKA